MVISYVYRSFTQNKTTFTKYFLTQWISKLSGSFEINWVINQSINQSNPVLLKERVRIPRTRRAGGAAMLWRRLPLDGVGSCRLFFTDDLHDNLSWVPASDKPHTFKSCFTHSSQVFFGRPGPFLPGTGLDLTLFISPLERMTCPNHLSRRSRTRMARSHIPSLACSSSIDGSSDGLTPQIQRIIAVLGKFHGFGGHSKCNSLQDRVNFHRSWAWAIVPIFNTYWFRS